MSNEFILNYFKKASINNEIGHAYLFSNAIYDNAFELLNEIINKYIYKKEINFSIDNNPEIYIVEPEKGVIKKEKIKELEENIIKTSQICGKKIYILKECEKMNASAANCLLKTLEEPSENVYAILLTSNTENVIPTIKSRCQVLQLKNDNNCIVNDEIREKTFDLINSIEENSVKSIAKDSVKLYKSYDKQELIEILNMVQLFYRDCLNKLYKLEIEYFKKNIEKLSGVLKNNTEKSLINKIKIINKNLSFLDYNLNLNLFIDKLFIELGRLQ